MVLTYSISVVRTTAPCSASQSLIHHILAHAAIEHEPFRKKLLPWTAGAVATAGFFFAVTPLHHFAGVSSWLAYAALAPCIAIFVYLFRRIERDERAVIEAVTAGRSSLTPTEFGMLYFSGDAVRIAARCRELFSELYQFDATRIHPDDRLCADLRFAARDGLEADEFVMALEEEFAVQFTTDEAGRLFTMRDIVEAILHKLQR